MTPEDRRLFNESRERMAELRRMQLELDRFFRVVLSVLIICTALTVAAAILLRVHR